MKLYLISQNENIDYDTFDSAVVCAESENDAREIKPDEYYGWGSWASSPKNVNVRYLGEACDGTEKGIICASFNSQ